MVMSSNAYSTSYGIVKSSLFRCFAVGTHLSAGSVDGVEVFAGFAVACDHVEDSSVAHLFLYGVVHILRNQGGGEGFPNDYV